MRLGLTHAVREPCFEISGGCMKRKHAIYPRVYVPSPGCFLVTFRFGC